jgi:hypothetical protein
LHLIHQQEQQHFLYLLDYKQFVCYYKLVVVVEEDMVQVVLVDKLKYQRFL